MPLYPFKSFAFGLHCVTESHYHFRVNDTKIDSPPQSIPSKELPSLSCSPSRAAFSLFLSSSNSISLINWLLPPGYTFSSRLELCWIGRSRYCFWRRCAGSLLIALFLETHIFDGLGYIFWGLCCVRLNHNDLLPYIKDWTMISSIINIRSLAANTTVPGFWHLAQPCSSIPIGNHYQTCQQKNHDEKVSLQSIQRAILHNKETKQIIDSQESNESSAQTQKHSRDLQYSYLVLSYLPYWPAICLVSLRDSRARVSFLRRLCNSETWRSQMRKQLWYGQLLIREAVFLACLDMD